CYWPSFCSAVRVNVRRMISSLHGTFESQRHLRLPVLAFGECSGTTDTRPAELVQRVYLGVAGELILPDINLRDKTAAFMDVDVSVELEQFLIGDGCSVVQRVHACLCKARCAVNTF